MDLLSSKWLSEMEMNDSSFNHQWQHTSSLENESFDIMHIPSPTNISNTLDYNHNNNNYASQMTQKSWKRGGVVDNSSSNYSSSSTIISFGNSELERLGKKLKPSPPSASVHHQISNLEDIYAQLEYGETKKGVSRTPEQAQDHILAERKRREKMTQKFIALSTLIPGLKKLDKATVLGDAINYIKELKERVNDLEAEVNGKHNEEAITVGAVKRPTIDNNTSSSGENIDGCISSIVFGSSNDGISPEIKVRSSDGNVIVRVYCKNQLGVIKGVMGEIENHNLTMISSSVMPFDENLHITIIAQMDAESKNITPKHLADHIRKSILNMV